MASGHEKPFAKGEKGGGTGKGPANSATTTEATSSETFSNSGAATATPGTSKGTATQRTKHTAKKGPQNSGKLPPKIKPMTQKRGLTDDDSDDGVPQPPIKGVNKPGKAPPKKRRKNKKGDTSEDDSADEAPPLASTRHENPHVRGGQPYNISQEPLATDFTDTGYQRDRRRLTLRNRIAPHPVTSEQLGDHLMNTGWNVDRAYHRWHAEHLQALARVGRGELIPPSFNVRVPPVDNEPKEEFDGEGSQESEDFIAYPHDANFERERRRLVAFLWKLVEEARALEGTVPLRRSEAVMLLRETSWDVIQARDLYLEHQFALDEFTNSYRHFEGPTPLRSERDNRLARLVDLTGGRDIDSLQAHLRRHNFNFIAAVVAWQRSGIPVVSKADRLDVEDEDPIPEDVSWESESPSDVEKEKEDGDDNDDQENDVVQHGFLINPDREGATKGVHDHTKMFIEYMNNGKYTARTFLHKGYRWSNKDPRDRPEFDFDNRDDINKLNNWRREIFQRKTGIQNNPRSTTWLEVEDDFLYELHRELWDDLIAEHPDDDPQSFLPLPVPASRQREWAERLNEEFEGTLQNGSDEPRPNRSFGALNTRRHRVQRIINDFALERNDPHPKDKEEEANDKGKMTKPPPKTGNKSPPKSDRPTKPQETTKRSQDQIKEENNDGDRDQDSENEYEDGVGEGDRGKKRKAKPSEDGPALKKPKAGKDRKI